MAHLSTESRRSRSRARARALARSVAVAITVVLAGLIAVSVRTKRTKAPTVAAAPTSSGEVAPSAPTTVPTAAPLGTAAKEDHAVRARWGSGRGELGRHRQSEGNPEGPMSFARRGDELLVLDQVNGRVVRYDAKGRVLGELPASSTTQDIAVAKDGSVLLLDRLREKSVRVFDASGSPRGLLSLSADQVRDPGLVTGVFTDGSDVYVEQEHGALTRIGTVDGQLADPALLTGRPSKDGSLLVSATLQGARLTVNAFDRKTGTLRFARVVPFPAPAESVALLDTDAHAVIYAGVTTTDAVNVACLDPGDGHVLGRVAIATDDMPEEQMRGFVVSDDGDIESSFRTEDGAEYHTARCP